MPKLKVGLIGANADRGWASVAHVAAIRAVEALELTAIATRNQVSADAAARAFGVPRAFADAMAMIRDPDIDLVSVVVRTPGHHDLVMAVITAGKPVFCEWPLGVDLTQGEVMAVAAQAAGVQTAIGLQGRSSPWLLQLKRLVADGYVGRILSTTLLVSDMFSTGEVDQANAYMLDVQNGANPLTIHGGHLLDALTDVLGEFAGVAAVTSTSRPHVTVRETGETIRSTSPDQIAVAGLLKDGAVACVQIRAGKFMDDALLWEIQGDRGVLRVRSAVPFVHWLPLSIEGAQDESPLRPLDPPPSDAFSAGEMASPGPHWTLARHYADFARGVLSGQQTVADFEQARVRHRLIDEIERSARAFATSTDAFA